MKRVGALALVLGALVTFKIHAEAQYQLGLSYQGAGRGVRMDRKKAAK